MRKRSELPRHANSNLNLDVAVVLKHYLRASRGTLIALN